MKVAKFETYSFAAIADWARDTLARGCEVISEGLACFRTTAKVGCIHQPVIVNGRHPKDLPDFCWINTMISNLKTASAERSTPYVLRSTLIATWAPSDIPSIVSFIWER